MKFMKLRANYKGKERVFDFLGENTLIYSKDNSVGKSTLLRIIFYSLGYPIPGTMSIKFRNLSLHMEIVVSEKTYVISRHNEKLELSFDNKKMAFILPREHSNFLKILFNTNNDKILKNILGAIYVDQDKGWTLLNRGIVIGKIRFNIEELIEGLAGTDTEELRNIKVYLECEKEKYSALKALDKYKGEQPEFWENYAKDFNELQKDIMNLNMKKGMYSRNLIEINKAISENKDFFSILESLKLVVRDGDKSISINKKNIVNFDDNFNFLKARRDLIEDEIAALDEKLYIKEIALNKKVEMLDIEDVGKDIAIVDYWLNHIDFRSIDSKLNSIKKQLTEINSLLRTKACNDTNSVTDRISDNIMEYAKKLGVDSVIESNNNFLFTKNLKEISGTQLYLITLCYKLGYIKELEKSLNIKLPIVLDSPNGREMTNENIDNVYNLLIDEFEGNQLIIASIFKNKEVDQFNVIEIKKEEKLFNSSDMQNSLLSDFDM